jgi:hypothetical protein
MSARDKPFYNPEADGAPSTPFGRCLCDDCCRQCPDRLIERKEQRQMVARKLRGYMKQSLKRW